LNHAVEVLRQRGYNYTIDDIILGFEICRKNMGQERFD